MQHTEISAKIPSVISLFYGFALTPSTTFDGTVKILFFLLLLLRMLQNVMGAGLTHWTYGCHRNGLSSFLKFEFLVKIFSLNFQRKHAKKIMQDNS